MGEPEGLEKPRIFQGRHHHEPDFLEQPLLKIPGKLGDGRVRQFSSQRPEGFPLLLDGASVTAPNLAFWTEDGFRIENEGVPPDIEVENTFDSVLGDKDLQLEQAVKESMKKIGG